MTYLFLTLAAGIAAYFILPKEMTSKKKIKISISFGLLTFILMTPLPVLIIPALLYASHRNRNLVLTIFEEPNLKQIDNAPDDVIDNQFIENDVCDFMGGCGNGCRCNRGSDEH